MSAPKLSTVQDSLCAYIQAEIAKQAGILSGIAFCREKFGTGDAAEIFDTALSSEGSGMCIFVTFPLTARLDQNPGKWTSIMCLLSVIVADNPTVNTTKNPLEVVEAIWAAVAKQSSKGPQFQLGSSPMDMITDEGELRTYVINFEIPISVQP